MISVSPGFLAAGLVHRPLSPPRWVARPGLMGLADLVTLAKRQDDAVSVAQAAASGVGEDALRHRVAAHGWTRPVRGALVVPPVRDPVRARARAALLVAGPGAVVCGVTAARLHELDLPIRHVAAEPVELLLPSRLRRAARRGVRHRRLDVSAGDRVDLRGLRC